MSQRLISRSADLKRLQDEGYEVEIHAGHLLLGHVPYRNAEGQVALGVLVSNLQLVDDTTVQPGDHVAHFAGGVPHGSDGQKLTKIINNEGQQALASDVVIDCSFSSKPPEGYRDYHHKMTTYVSMVSEPARALDPTVTATTFPVITDEDEDSVFNYIDSASSRAGIAIATSKLEVRSVAIVGLGGTGSYILDFLAKTPVEKIHLFDGDSFLQHNAFRSPGAPSGEDLRRKQKKVEHFGGLYSRIRRNIVEHPYFVNASNVEELRTMDWVFIAADDGPTKRLLSGKLQEFGVPFIDVGMGLVDTDGSLGGLVRVTTSTPSKHDHVDQRISSADGTDADDLYAQNIQIAELNALNAALAVIRWKKACGFYVDQELEHNAIYMIGGNCLINEDNT